MKLHDLEQEIMNLWNMIDIIPKICESNREDKLEVLSAYAKALDIQLEKLFNTYKEILPSERTRTSNRQTFGLSDIGT